MPGTFKNTTLDFVSLGLTILAFIFQNIGFCGGPWWIHNGNAGKSSYSMTGLTICEMSCMDKGVLDIKSGWEWMVSVILFEVFGECCVALALIMAVLAVTLRLRVIHTGVIYIHGIAAVFILLGVFIFFGFYATLDKLFEGEESGFSQFPCYMCLIAALFCISSSCASGLALKKHLLEWDDYISLVK